MKRTSGVFLHISSLPSKEGIGSLGKEAYNFVDMLAEAGQTYWQILPLCQPDNEGSPYASECSSSGNILLIDLKKLCEYGLLELSSLPRETEGEIRADFKKAETIKLPLFAEAYGKLGEHPELVSEFHAFCERNRDWLDDYALYKSIKTAEGKDWSDWKKELKFRDKKALDEYAKNNANDIEYHMFLQFIFDKQWKELKQYSNERGIRILGDIPIYVNYSSSDVWAEPDEFLLDEGLSPKKVAGVPPDYFSENGQLWGNPLYNWELMRINDYRWWRKRISRCAERFDALRIDHFRAFDTYWAVDADAETAKEGCWVKGEGVAIASAIKQAAGNMELIAEDLGEYSEGVKKLRESFSLPGMRVLEFAFSGGSENAFLPHNYEENTIAYIGTHDNDTAVGWWSSLSSEQRNYVFNYTGFETENEINRKLMKLLSRSRAKTVIFTVQDIIGLGSDRRMNVPGSTGCWRFMLKEGELTREDMNYLGEITALFGRNREKTVNKAEKQIEK